MKDLVRLLLGLSLLLGACAAQTPGRPTPCGTKAVAPIDPSRLTSAPPPVAAVEDPPGDFLLDHPLFERNFDVLYENNAAIPPALDILAVNVELEDRNYCFRVRTAGRNLPDLLQAGRHSARIAVYVDRDLNGASDVLLSTTDQPERGVVTTSEFALIEHMPRIAIERNSVTLCLSGNSGRSLRLAGVSGFSPVERAYYRTSLEYVFVVPVVDVAYARARMVEILSSYSGTGTACQVIQTQFNSCPAAGNPPQVPVPATSYQGVLIYQKQCGGLGYALWCISGSFFGKRVFQSSSEGWVARCPFTCGFNNEDEWDPNVDGVPDGIFHSVTDADCGSSHIDQDGDGLRDTMTHDYGFSSNLVTSCDVERNQNGTQVAKRCLPPRVPYADPATVPGSIT
jgi:hypothetical protein